MKLPKDLHKRIKANQSTVWRLNRGHIRFPDPDMVTEIIEALDRKVPVLDFYPDVKKLLKKYGNGD